MDKTKIFEALKKLKADSKKRNFKQTVDLIINLKELDIKKTENQIDFFMQLPHLRGRKAKICAFVDNELKTQSDQVMDKTITTSDFPAYQNSKAMMKKLAKTYDYFIAQATIMPKIATTFGKVLGSRGKMPNPKAGCIVPPNANLKQVYEKLQNQIHVKAKTAPAIQIFLGKEDSNEEELAANALAIYDTLLHHLPNEKANIRAIKLKLTMSKPVKIE